MDVSKTELAEIMHAYGCDDFIYDGHLLVEPDTELYFYHDKDNKKYLLIVADYLGVFDFGQLPQILKFDYYRRVSYTLIRELLPQEKNSPLKWLDHTMLFEYSDSNYLIDNIYAKY